MNPTEDYFWFMRIDWRIEVKIWNINKTYIWFSQSRIKGKHRFGDLIEVDYVNSLVSAFELQINKCLPLNMLCFYYFNSFAVENITISKFKKY